MFRIDRFTPSALLAIAGAAALVAGSAPALAAGSIKAAYVEQVIPSKTFFDSMTLFNNVSVIGPGTGILGVTSITITNFDSGPQQVFIFAPVLSGGTTCNGGTVVATTAQHLQVYIQPLATMHLTYPTPLVFNPASGLTCVGAEVTTALHGGSVEIDVNGVIN